MEGTIQTKLTHIVKNLIMPSNSEVFIINVQTLLFYKHTISPPVLVVVQLPNMYKALYTV